MKKSMNLFIGISVLLMVGIYILPFLLSYSYVKMGPLPLDFSSDVYLYLNYTLLHPSNDGFVMNPWYHVLVPAEQLTYLKYGLLNLFSALNAMLSHNLALTLVVWNAVWSLITFLTAFLLFKRISGADNIWALIFGVSLLFFFQISALPTYLHGWAHFPGVDFFSSALLPLQRTFFPQLAIPLLLLYLYFLIDAFETGKIYQWPILFIVQFIAFINFPYNTVLMGMTTLLYIIFLFFAKKRLPWRAIVIFGIAVIAADLFYLLHGSVSSNDTERHTSIIEFNISVIKEILGGTTMALLILSFLTLLIQAKNRYIKFALSSLGFGLFLLLFCDVFIKSKAQLTHHFFYFINPVISILLFYTLVKTSVYIKKYRQVLFAIGTFFLVSTGVLITYAQTQKSLSDNIRNSFIIESLKKIDPTKNDLIIAPANNVNDVATWIPLIAPSEVLFSRNSEYLLPNSEKGHEIYWKREAIYLYLKGVDSKKLHQILFETHNDNAIKKIIMVGQRFDLDSEERNIILEDVFRKISYWLNIFEEHPQTLKDFFSKYDRIIVIEKPTGPKFSSLSYFTDIGKFKKDDLAEINVYKIIK